MVRATTRPTVLLFDIDGTLILTGGAGRRAMVAAFVALYGRDDVFEGVSFGGMTDRAIARQGIVATRRPRATTPATPAAAHARDDAEVDPSAIDAVLERYLAALADELPKAQNYRIMPGVLAVLETLATVKNVAIGLGTGNVKRGAYAKLAQGALDGAFAFGGFGCDAEDRTELLRHGARRGAEALGAPYEECRVVIIGDTDRDVRAAIGLGAECIAVGTGGFEPKALVALGAHHGFATLEDPGVHAALLA